MFSEIPLPFAPVPGNSFFQFFSKKLRSRVVDWKTVLAAGPTVEGLPGPLRIARPFEKGGPRQEVAGRSKQRRENAIIAVLIVRVQGLNPVRNMQKTDKVVHGRVTGVGIKGSVPNPANLRVTNHAQMESREKSNHRQMPQPMSDVDVDLITPGNVFRHDTQSEGQR